MDSSDYYIQFSEKILGFWNYPFKFSFKLILFAFYITKNYYKLYIYYPQFMVFAVIICGVVLTFLSVRNLIMSIIFVPLLFPIVFYYYFLFKGTRKLFKIFSGYIYPLISLIYRLLFSYYIDLIFSSVLYTIVYIADYIKNLYITFKDKFIITPWKKYVSPALNRLFLNVIIPLGDRIYILLNPIKIKVINFLRNSCRLIHYYSKWYFLDPLFRFFINPAVDKIIEVCRFIWKVLSIFINPIWRIILMIIRALGVILSLVLEPFRLILRLIF